MSCLFLLVTYKCNLNCIDCFYNTGYLKRPDCSLTATHAARLAKKIRKLGIQSVILTGGDPLCVEYKKEAFKLISALKSEGLKVFVNSSATQLSRCDFRKLVELRPDRIDISIDSHIASIHNAQRGDFNSSVSAIRGLMDFGYKNITTTTVVSKRNKDTVYETVEWLGEIGIEDVRVQPMFLPGEQSGREEIVNAIRNLNLKPKPHLEQYIGLLQAASRDEIPSSHISCQMGRTYFVCAPDGLLSNCFHQPKALGNLLTDSVETLSGNFSELSASHKCRPDCFGWHCVSLFDNPTFWRRTDNETQNSNT